MFMETKLRRGMIFLRIRGGCQTLGYGGKIHVSPPCLIFPSFLVLSNYHFNALQSSWGSYCWGVECGRIVSPCPHAHSTSESNLTLGRRTTTPIVPLSPWRCYEHSHTSHSPFLIVAHSHVGKNVLCLTQRILFFCWSHAAKRGEPFWLSFMFSIERYLVCFHLYIWI